MASRPKTVPVMTTDEEAEALLKQDLSDLDVSQFKKMNWKKLKEVAASTRTAPKP
jgi:predicted DNA binding CopG/RHH family protein